MRIQNIQALAIADGANALYLTTESIHLRGALGNLVMVIPSHLVCWTKYRTVFGVLGDEDKITLCCALGGNDEPVLITSFEAKLGQLKKLDGDFLNPTEPPTIPENRPDSTGYWWFKKRGKTEWLMIHLREFGNGKLTAYAMDNSYGGATIDTHPDFFVGHWVKVLPPG